MFYSTDYASPVGPLRIASDGDSIIGLWLADGHKYLPVNVVGEGEVRDDLPVLAAAVNWLECYFNKQRPSITELPLKPEGSTFRQEVWEILCDIPYGEWITYGEIARQMASRRGKVKMSAQAVGGAVGHNPISIVIPCHRVIGTNGNLTGYGGGIERKVQLLEHEGVDVSQFSLPKKRI